jgi:hypothetical protein
VSEAWVTADARIVALEAASESCAYRKRILYLNQERCKAQDIEDLSYGEGYPRSFQSLNGKAQIGRLYMKRMAETSYDDQLGAY